MHAEDQSAKIKKDGMKVQCNKVKWEIKWFNNRSEDWIANKIKSKTKKQCNKITADI